VEVAPVSLTAGGGFHFKGAKMKRHGQWSKHNRSLEIAYQRAAKAQDYDTALEVGLKLGYSWEAICARLEVQQRENLLIERQQREARRCAIAKRFSVPVSYVMLEDELAEWRATAGPRFGFLTNFRMKAQAALRICARAFTAVFPKGGRQ
jgi:hypothetical protein